MEAGTKPLRGRTLDMTYIALFTVLIAVCSWITIPMVVPFTMQTFAVLLAVGVLGGKRGTLAVLVYILLGAVGLPVFAGFSGGPGILLGSTGGYIAGFLFSALFMWAMETALGRKRWVFALSSVLGLIICYAVGSLWFMLVYSRTVGPVGLGAVLGWCVVPFIIPDLAKTALAVTLTGRLSKIMKTM